MDACTPDVRTSTSALSRGRAWRRPTAGRGRRGDEPDASSCRSSIFYPDRAAATAAACRATGGSTSGADDLTLDEIDEVADALPALGTRSSCSRAASRCCGRRCSTRRDCSARGALAAPAHERRAARAIRRPTSRSSFSRVIVSLDARDRALYRAVRGVDGAGGGRARRRAAAPICAGCAGDGSRHPAPAELPRAAAARRSRARRWRSTASRFCRPTCRRRRSARGARRRAEPRRCARPRPRRGRASSRRSSSTRSRATRDDFASGFVAESPDKLRRLPRYYAALAGDGAVSAGVVQCAVDVGRGRSRRLRPALLLP